MTEEVGVNLNTDSGEQDYEKLFLIHKLHERHPGLTVNLCNQFAEAASVCLARHHSRPKEFTVILGEDAIKIKRVVDWEPPTALVRRAWNNDNDATENGAYGMAIAAAESKLDLVAVERAETLTGADWYLTVAEQTMFLEHSYRLEVSGVDNGNEAAVASRLKRKVKQAIAGNSNIPALASVVGFRVAVIAMQRVQA